MAAAGKIALVLDASRPCGRRGGAPTSRDDEAAVADVVDWTLPLVAGLRALSADGVAFQVALRLAPAVGAWLRDPRFTRRVDERLAGAAASERLRAAWAGTNRDLVGALADLESAGRVEILGGTATEAPLPLLACAPQSVRAQVSVGCAEHLRLLGHRPRALWLPGGAWAAGLDEVLADEGVSLVVLEQQGVDRAVPRPLAGVHAPVVTPAGVAVLAADTEASRAFVAPDVAPADLLAGLVARGGALAARMDRVPLFVVAPDLVPCAEGQPAELLDRVEAVLRRASAGGSDLDLVTPGGLFEPRARVQRAVPVASARAAQSSAETWADGASAFTLRHVHQASRTMTALARARPDARGLERRALTQAARELLLLEGSAGALLARTAAGQTVDEVRFRLHLSRFLHLAESIQAGTLDEGWLRDVEGRDDPFETLDYRVYC